MNFKNTISLLCHIMLEIFNFHEKILEEYEKDKNKFDDGFFEWVKQVPNGTMKKLSFMQQYGI